MIFLEREGRGFLRGTSSAGQQWPAIAMVGGETGNPIYTFLPNNQPTLAICKTIYSDHQALQEHAYNPQCGQNSQNTSCGQKSQKRVVFRTRASRSCGKTYNLWIYAHSEHMWSKYENLLDLLWRTTGEGIKKHYYIFQVEACSMLKESWQRASCISVFSLFRHLTNVTIVLKFYTWLRWGFSFKSGPVGFPLKGWFTMVLGGGDVNLSSCQRETRAAQQLGHTLHFI